MDLQAASKAVPVVVPISKRLFGGPRSRSAAPAISFPTSGDCRETRYARGGNSGAGSYSRLASFKAKYLAGFVERHGIRSVVEFGSGDGAQLELIRYPDYVGVEGSRTALAQTRARFAERDDIRFIHTSKVTDSLKADLSLSLDVIDHLVEDGSFDASMRQLFDAARRYVIVYSSSKDEPGPADHVCNRRFGDWIEANRPDFVLDEHAPNWFLFDAANPHETSFADLYVYRKA